LLFQDKGTCASACDPLDNAGADVAIITVADIVCDRGVQLIERLNGDGGIGAFVGADVAFPG